MATLVKFLVDQDGGNTFAYFPQLTFGIDKNMKTSYAHIGQHSACSKWYAEDCRPANRSQYITLATELTSIGYSLKILNKN